MVAIKNVVAFAASVSAAVLPRDGATVLNDLQTLDYDVNQLNDAVSAGSINSVAIAADVSNVLADLSDSTGATTASGTIVLDASQIVSYIQSTLGPDALAAISTLDTRRDVFIASAEDLAVLTDLRDLRSATADLAAALESAIPLSATDLANEFDAVDTAFAQAIRAYDLN